MRNRVLTALVAIPLVLGWVWVADRWDLRWLTSLLTALVAAVAAWEYEELARKAGCPVRRGLLVGLSVGLVAVMGVVLGQPWDGWELLIAPLIGLSALLVGTLVLWTGYLFGGGTPQERLHGAGAVTLGWVYIPGLLQVFPWAFAAFDLPASAQPGPGPDRFTLVVGLLALVWAYDTGAFFAGRFWGRRKLAPALSPGKTWEGVVGGLLLSVGVAFGGLWALWPEWPPATRLGHALGLGVLVGGAAQLGDLFESLLKRAAGVKDSGRLFPGHGGLLDRLDGLLFALPVYVLYVGLLLSL